jgi:cobalt-zinc-cadmium efflux system outer membrane protein
MTPRFWAPGLVLLALARPAFAAPLTYDQALARANASAPALAAADLRTDAARSAARASGNLPDPQLKFGVDNYPVSGPMAGRFGADEMTMATVGFMQEIPNRARRRAEMTGAEAEIGLAQSQRAMTEREVRVVAALAWLDLYYAQERRRPCAGRTGPLDRRRGAFRQRSAATAGVRSGRVASGTRRAFDHTGIGGRW